MSFDVLIDYFAAERQGGLQLVIVSLASLSLAWFLWNRRSAFIAMIWPLVTVGILMGVLGFSLILRTPSQVAEIEHGLQTNIEQTVQEEIERMENVNRGFRLLKRLEISCIIICLTMVAVFPISSTTVSISLGILLESVIVLVLDTFAYSRALEYTHWLTTLST